MLELGQWVWIEWCSIWSRSNELTLAASHHDGKRTQDAVLCIWLTKLGVKLPSSDAFGKDDFRSLLCDIATSCSKAYSRQHEPALPFLTKSLTKSGGLLYRLPAHLL